MSRHRDKRRSHRLLPAFAIAATGVVWATSAEAATTPLSAAVIARACAGHGGQEISQAVLGTALLIEAGKVPTEWVADLMDRPDPTLSPAQIYARSVTGRLGEVGAGSRAEPRDDGYLLRATIDVLQLKLRTPTPGEEPPLAFGSAVPPRGPFLFQPAFAGVMLKCKVAEPGDSFLKSWEDFTAPPLVSVRSTPEELALVGDDRHGAGAFALAWDRTRSTLDDGTRKTDTSLKVNGTVGVRITPATSANAVSYLYGRYALSHARTRPKPVLAPGASESDGDTDALETGILFQKQIMPGKDRFKLFLNLQAATIFDFANDASRVKIGALLRPVLATSLGVCGLERYARPLPGTALRTRCGFQLEVLGAEVLRRGTTPLANYDSFLAAGGRGTFEAFLPTADGMELAATVRYRFLPVLHGAPRRIERLEAELKHRFWTASDVGIDVGFTYIKGANEVSFEKEDILSFGLGIIL
jgi:hypothetical protein